ncbi:MAG: AbrB/MazE/SpoVT family DNA-binding domain-containing protein [Candidatus Altiarchaeales archaeon]|nr:AbrB/MazE/SpoVT family DNA-binding domain-containing protein [Candidatus Altiarchaeales archaeon]
MMPIDVEVRRWGNSFGVTIPKDVARREQIRENQHVKVLILASNKKVKQSFGMVRKLIKNAQEAKDNLRRELYNE